MVDGISQISAASKSADAPSSALTKARLDAMAAAAAALNMSAADMRGALGGGSGESLTQLAASRGVSTGTIQNAIESALKKDLPDASQAQISALASRMMSSAHGSESVKPADRGGSTANDTNSGVLNRPIRASTASSTKGPETSDSDEGRIHVVV